MDVWRFPAQLLPLVCSTTISLAIRIERFPKSSRKTGKLLTSKKCGGTGTKLKASDKPLKLLLFRIQLNQAADFNTYQINDENQKALRREIYELYINIAQVFPRSDATNNFRPFKTESMMVFLSMLRTSSTGAGFLEKEEMWIVHVYVQKSASYMDMVQNWMKKGTVCSLREPHIRTAASRRTCNENTAQKKKL